MIVLIEKEKYYYYPFSNLFSTFTACPFLCRYKMVGRFFLKSQKLFCFSRLLLMMVELVQFAIFVVFFFFGTIFCAFDQPNAKESGNSSGQCLTTNSAAAPPSPLNNAAANANNNNNQLGKGTTTTRGTTHIVGTSSGGSGGVQQHNCSKENCFLLKVCFFLANRTTKMGSEWATGAPGFVLLNPGKLRWRCANYLNGMLTASTTHPHMDKWVQFRFAPEDGQKNLLLSAILIGGPLLAKLNIYDTSIDYDTNFFNTILKYVIYNESTHAKMVDKLLIVTKPTQWPTVLINLMPMDSIEKMHQWEEHSVNISSNSNHNLRLTVTLRVKPPFGYGFIYTVERAAAGGRQRRHGDTDTTNRGEEVPMPLFKIGLFNDLREPQQQKNEDGHHHHSHHFVMFVVEKVGPDLVNHL